MSNESPLPESRLQQQLAAIGLLVLDVDGVLTDGRFTLDEEGRETKTFHTQDGFGIRQLIDNGIVVAIITGRRSGAVAARARELDIEHVIQGARDKTAAIKELMNSTGITKDRAAAVGDDIPDLAMFAAVGLPIAVNNAVDTVKAAATMITDRQGGHGAVREISDLILRCKE